jgi:glycine/serine hydroxymethyltransferase
MKEREMGIIAGIIKDVLEDPEGAEVQKEARSTVADLCREFPIYDFLQ